MKLNFKALFVVLVFAVVSFSFKAGDLPAAKNEINWMTWAEVQEAQKKEPKKVFVDVYTGWCGWCKRMDATTFHNEEIVDYINDNYYAVKFDAEQRETLVFKGRKYHYTKTGKRGYNELATSLLEGVMSFPTTVYLDENLDVLTKVGGFLEANELDPIISYFATDSYLKKKWSQYEKSYKSIL
ncbi:MAG: thioredoxin-related protein [Planctomycetota bacterium]|jgi:thioredoxin-related protein